MKNITIKTKRLKGQSRYQVSVAGKVYEVMKRWERSEYNDQPWDITADVGNGPEWIQTFPTKKRCIEWLAWRAMNEGE